ncbi:unnamed protein product [Dracunculus medinensis]|uniref:Uncharacterized protein n=1 Tax=Dracunculus medinensis TaxID=318479 RepID=A0A3P7QL55_DRAME|nr:unnamed protein product [Dracunculus medinensis]
MASGDEPLPFTFRTHDGLQIQQSISHSLFNLELIYYPEAIFQIRPVTRCTSSIPGHGEPVVSIQFSPDSRNLASGSGDKTVRLWDLTTELPLHTCVGHSSWVLCLGWAPDGKKLASSCKSGEIIIWNPLTGKQIGHKLTGHKQWINQLVWEPYHINPNSRHLASAGKDSVIRIWDTFRCTLLRCLTGHTQSVTCLAWGGLGLIYSGSQDRTIKVWRFKDGVLCRTLSGHAHWVNTLALNVEYVLRTSCFDPKSDSRCCPTEKENQKLAYDRYEKVKNLSGGEILASGSDDFTLYLWHPANEKKPIARMTGHMQAINQVMFSPDARFIASASFDKSIKLWCGRTGKFIDSLRGHVQAVYRIAWSSDSRLLVSGSADSTLKVCRFHLYSPLCEDLPGHSDQVYAVDWSPNGERVASGGKDKVVKMWRN